LQSKEETRASDKNCGGNFSLQAFSIILSGAFYCAVSSALATAHATQAFCSYQYRQQVMTVNGNRVAIEIYEPKGTEQLDQSRTIHGVGSSKGDAGHD
jgi:hypothetical protein